MPKTANFCKKWLKLAENGKFQYLKKGKSYTDDLPLILTAMSTFLLCFEILK